ncbi:hypothetical protein JHK87_056431 [Glycine soja]|nr:hypothetical protein JHK87_056431 [Glycine soja]
MIPTYPIRIQLQIADQSPATFINALKKAFQQLKQDVSGLAGMALFQSVANGNPGHQFFAGASSSAVPNVVLQSQPLPVAQVFPPAVPQMMFPPPMFENYMVNPNGFDDMGMGGGGFGGAGPSSAGGGGGGFF